MSEEIPGALKDPMPRKVEPMIPTEFRKPFDREGWTFELKVDGFRTLARIDEGRVSLYSRRLNAFTERFSPVTASLKDIKGQVILDGEVAVVDEAGKSQFEWVKSYNHRSVNPGRLAYFVFDILYLDGYDLRELPLEERKQRLQPVIPEDLENVLVLNGVKDEGIDLFKLIQEQGLEGIVAKNSQSTYKAGVSKEWLKVKNYVRHGWKKVVYRDI